MGARGGRWVIGGLAVALVALLVAIAVLATSRESFDDDLTAAQREVAEAARAEASPS